MLEVHVGQRLRVLLLPPFGRPIGAVHVSFEQTAHAWWPPQVRRELDVRRLLIGRRRIKVCAANVNKKYLLSSLTSRVKDLPRLSVKVGHGMGQHHAKRLEWRCRREDRLLPRESHFPRYEPAANVGRLVVALVRLDPSHTDGRTTSTSSTFQRSSSAPKRVSTQSNRALFV